MTLIDGIRRAAVGLGSVALVATMASAVQADDLHRPPATGFATVDGVEVEMLVGPTCTWDAPEDDSRASYYSRKNVVCNNDDKAWHADAPVLKAAPVGDMTYRWATDAQPLFVDTWTANARGAQPAPASFAATAVWSCADTTNPCTIKRADVSSGGVTYIAEARWGETSSTKYAVTLRG